MRRWKGRRKGRREPPSVAPIHFLELTSLPPSCSQPALSKPARQAASTTACSRGMLGTPPTPPPPPPKFLLPRAAPATVSLSMEQEQGQEVEQEQEEEQEVHL